MIDDPVPAGTRPAVFIDRDGTVIDEVNYLSRLEDIRPVPGAADALRSLRSAGFAVVLVTNQSGVARGYFDEAFVRESHRALEDMLHFDFDGIYYCPHGPDSSCDCRKPRPGMIEKAVHDLHLSLGGSYVIGDKPADMDMAAGAGLSAVLVRTGYGSQSEEGSCAVHVAEDLPEACAWIVKRTSFKK